MSNDLKSTTNNLTIPYKITLSRKKIFIQKIFIFFMLLTLLPIIFFYSPQKPFIEIFKIPFVQACLFLFFVLTPIWVIRIVYHKKQFINILKDKIIIGGLITTKEFKYSEISDIAVTKNPNLVLVPGKAKTFSHRVKKEFVTIFLNFEGSISLLEHYSKYVYVLTNLPYEIPKKEIATYLKQALEDWRQTPEGKEAEKVRIQKIEDYRKNKGKIKRKTDWVFLLEQGLQGLVLASIALFVIFVIVLILFQ